MAVGTTTPNAAILLLLAYVWIAALVLGHGMTRVLVLPRPDAGGVPNAAGARNAVGPGSAGGAVGARSAGGAGNAGSAGAVALLSSPATVYACEIAMTVLTGLMLLT
jgi:hypothetical protein